MVGLAVVKSLYALPTWTRTVALVRDQAALRNVLGAVPSVHAAYRFAAKLGSTRTSVWIKAETAAPARPPWDRQVEGAP